MAAFERQQLLAAFDHLGAAAAEAGTVLHIAVYGDSALMLASNFCFASEHADVGELPDPWPEWLSRAVSTSRSAMAGPPTGSTTPWHFT